MSTRSRITLIFFLSFLVSTIHAQVQVSGTILDDLNEPLPGAAVRVFDKDSAMKAAVVTDPTGAFTFTLPASNAFTLYISYIGISGAGKKMAFRTGETTQVLKPIRLKELGQNLQEVDVKTVQNRGEQNGDTTAFNAAAFKTNPDATAEDLVKKMPGITSDNNGIKVNGETVQKVLVDGKPFFGDDPNAALKNLPADLIEKVEVFDKMSDQSAFTGFNDGDQQKTINLVTKKGKNVGQFGRVYAGAGGDENYNARYSAGAALNSFNNNQRISLLLMSNNVNQQNFSTSDISGAMGSSQGGRGRRGDPGAALMTAPQNGITTTQSAGLNYSDMWGKKISVSGSYFFNTSENLNAGNIERNYFTQNDLRYTESSNERVFNLNHRLNFRMEYTIDSNNKIIYTPSLSFQDNDARNQLSGQNFFGDQVRLSSTNTSRKILTNALDLNNNLLFQHKFGKQGRTFSINLGNTTNNRGNNGNYYSLNNYGDTATVLLDQRFDTESKTSRNTAYASYTEPLSKTSQLQISYNPSLTRSYSDKETVDFDPISDEYNSFNSSLSNKYENTYLTQKGGLSYRIRKEKLSTNIGLDGQQANLRSQQTFPREFLLNQNFSSILPHAMMNYRFSKTKNIRLYYRSSTNIPNVSQLQEVLDITNPLQVRSGNAGLKQTFENNLNLRFGGFDPATSKNIMFFLNGNYTNNYISNGTYILEKDSSIQGYELRAGTQLSKPVNLDGFYSGRAFMVYGFPLKALKSNMNVSAGLNYNHTPGLFINVLNFSNSYAGNAGLMISSNVSEKLDFSISYNGNYTVVKNTVQTKSDNSFYSQSSNLKVNWLVWKGLVINSDISHTMYTGLNQSFNQQYFLWNAYVGYKFLKSKALEAKISVFDILNQNRNISRSVTGSYTEDSYTTVLRRYAMFSLTYTIKHFKSGTAPKTEDNPMQVPEGIRPPDHPRGQNH